MFLIALASEQVVKGTSFQRILTFLSRPSMADWSLPKTSSRCDSMATTASRTCSEADRNAVERPRADAIAESGLCIVAANAVGVTEIPETAAINSSIAKVLVTCDSLIRAIRFMSFSRLVETRRTPHFNFTGHIPLTTTRLWLMEVFFLLANRVLPKSDPRDGCRYPQIRQSNKKCAEKIWRRTCCAT